MEANTEIKMFDKVTEPYYYHHEVFTVVGIRPNELELQGDWSGGTHNVCQRSWIDKKDVKLYN